MEASASETKMEDVSNYFLILEDLKFNKAKGNGEVETMTADMMQENIGILKKHLDMDLKMLVGELSKKLEYSVSILFDEKTDDIMYYVCGIELTLLNIVQNANFESEAKEDLVSLKHISLCIQALQNVSPWALTRFVDKCFQGVAFYLSKRSEVGLVINDDFLMMNVKFFAAALAEKRFCSMSSMEMVIQDFMCSIYTLLLNYLNEEFKTKLHDYLNYVWNSISKLDYFRNLIIMKGMANIPQTLKRNIHKDLLKRLVSKDGYSCLVTTIHLSKNEDDPDDKKTFELIANIVCYSSVSDIFHKTMVKEVSDFIDLCILNESMADVMGAGLLTLRRLYDLNRTNQKLIKKSIASVLMKFVEPPDILAGLIIMEHREICLMISRLYNLFCTSIVECLPLMILQEYLPLLLTIYYDLPPSFVQKQQLGMCIIRCLHHSNDKQLKEIIQNLFLVDDKLKWRYIHPRVIILPNDMQTEITVKIASSEYKIESHLSTALPELLMSSSFHLLTYRVFMELLKLLMDNLDNSNTNIDLNVIQTEEELLSLINEKYLFKIEILLSLSTLISHEPLKFQLTDHFKDFLKFIREMLDVYIKAYQNASQTNAEKPDQSLIIILTLMEEMLERNADYVNYISFIPTLKQIDELSPSTFVKQRIAFLISGLSNEKNDSDQLNSNKFQSARSLIESNESYLQAYGIQKFIHLIKTKDPYTLANKHRVLALAMTTLQDKESYTFLNTVRLFVALVYIMEAEIFDYLSEKYLNEQTELDQRLVTGEAIIKVSQEIGELCYKYKDVLVNTFMNGCRSPLNEFRMSAFSNLAQLCKTLTYQVHTYFNELIDLIDSELSTGEYLPSKRAAILVLEELLDGMPSLVDFGEMLKPIYEILKIIESNPSSDDVMRLHANKGLNILSQKCKDFLFPPQKLEKEIKIFGIKDDAAAANKSSSSSKSILELD